MWPGWSGVGVWGDVLCFESAGFTFPRVVVVDGAGGAFEEGEAFDFGVYGGEAGLDLADVAGSPWAVLRLVDGAGVVDDQSA